MDLGKNAELKSDKWNTNQKVSQQQAVATKAGRKNTEWEVWFVLAALFLPRKAEAKSICTFQYS